MQDAFHLRTRVDTSVVGRVSILAASLRTAEVHASRQFAHAEEIGALHDLRLERRAVGQRVEYRQRTQVGVKSQRLAHPEQSLFGAYFRRRVVVVLGVADGTEEHGVRRLAYFVRLGGVGIARDIDGTGAYQRLFIGERMTVLGGYGVERLHRFAHDLGADAVSRQTRDFQIHISLFRLVCRWNVMPLPGFRSC